MKDKIKYVDDRIPGQSGFRDGESGTAFMMLEEYVLRIHVGNSHDISKRLKREQESFCEEESLVLLLDAAALTS